MLVDKSPTPNIVLLRKHGTSRMNSDEKVTKSSNASLHNFVRLSFCSKNTMMYVSKTEGRISEPVVLRIKLEVVSRPGVLFSDCNATRHDVNFSTSPEVVRFDVVRAESCFKVPEL